MKIAKALGHALPQSRQPGKAAIKAESAGPAGRGGRCGNRARL